MSRSDSGSRVWVTLGCGIPLRLELKVATVMSGSWVIVEVLVDIGRRVPTRAGVKGGEGDVGRLGVRRAGRHLPVDVHRPAPECARPGEPGDGLRRTGGRQVRPVEVGGEQLVLAGEVGEVVTVVASLARVAAKADEAGGVPVEHVGPVKGEHAARAALAVPVEGEVVTVGPDAHLRVVVEL